MGKKKTIALLHDRAMLTNMWPYFRESCPLYRAPRAHGSLPFSSQSVWCVHYYYIISPGVYMENDLTHLLTCHLIGGGTQKAWPSTPSPTVGHTRHQWAALQFLWWLSIILDNVSQWQNRHHSKVIFTPAVDCVHGREEASRRGGWKPHLCFAWSTRLCLSFLDWWDNINREGPHSSLFLRYTIIILTIKMCFN